MDSINISRKLSELRTAKGATQEEVANALGISNKTLSKWENGTSSPDLNMLVALADYYGVTTDTLLGLSSGETDIKKIIAQSLCNLNRNEIVLKVNEIVTAIIPGCTNTTDPNIEVCTDEPSPIPPQRKYYTKCCIDVAELFAYTICSDEVNISVMQWQNKQNFGWLLEDDKQECIADLLRFLGDKDTLKVMYFLHSSAYSRHFTPEYAAACTGIPLDRMAEILEKCCEYGLCAEHPALLMEGETSVYEAYGNGMLLAILSVAYEKLYSRHYFDQNYGNNSKLIGGGIDEFLQKH